MDAITPPPRRKGRPPDSEPGIIPIASITDPLDPQQHFPKQQPLDIELGAGDGSFLIDWARQRPDINFLGVERLLGRLRKIGKRAAREGLDNVRGLRIEGAYLLRHLLPPHSVSHLHVYFPDPWPKRRHHRRRLVNESFPELAARVLVPGGTVYLRTDDTDYFEQMQRVFQEGPAVRTFQSVSTPDDLAACTTDFERDFNELGIPTQRAAFRLSSS